VEHVHVHSGGQAVVGMVQTPGGGDQQKSEDQPHAKQIAHAPQPAMWGEDAPWHLLPVPRDAERPLPAAWRFEHRPAHTGWPRTEPPRPLDTRGLLQESQGHSARESPALA
jgi:hypothetical protein